MRTLLIALLLSATAFAQSRTFPAPPDVAAPPNGNNAPASADDLIRSAAQDLEDYQRLTAEGKLGEAGQRLESLKQKLQDLQNRR